MTPLDCHARVGSHVVPIELWHFGNTWQASGKFLGRTIDVLAPSAADAVAKWELAALRLLDESD